MLSHKAVAPLLNNTFPNRLPITKSTVQRTVIRFEQTGSIKDRPRTGRPKTASNDDKNIRGSTIICRKSSYVNPKSKSAM